MKPKRAGGKRALRNRAERILADKASPASPAAPEELLHELEVHQVELELQVEELRRAEAEIEKMRDRYLSLYDGAPVGYVTLNGYGLITQVNRTAEKILGTARPLLRARRFSSFLDHGSRSTFLSVIADARSSGTRRTIRRTARRSKPRPHVGKARLPGGAGDRRAVGHACRHHGAARRRKGVAAAGGRLAQAPGKRTRDRVGSPS